MRDGRADDEATADAAAEPTKPPSGKDGAAPAVRTCQVCGNDFDDGPVVLCRQCATPHHRECWRYNRGCTVYGCGCRTFMTPSPSLQGGGRETFTAQQPTSNLIFVVILVTAILSLIGGIVLTGVVKSAIPLFFGIPLYVALLSASIGYKTFGHYLLSFDRATGAVSRQLMVRGRPVHGVDHHHLLASDIVEVHLHKYVDPQIGFTEQVHVALHDGRRELIQQSPVFRGPQPASLPSLDELAERVADFADTTVRLCESSLPPSSEEILQAAAERRLVEGGAAAALSQPSSSTDPDDAD